jgi:hypothetical protein
VDADSGILSESYPLVQAPTSHQDLSSMDAPMQQKINSTPARIAKRGRIGNVPLQLGW